MQRLIDYFSVGILPPTNTTVGAEIETQFVNQRGLPVTTQTTQQMFDWLVANRQWQVVTRKNGLTTALIDPRGNLLSYDLGRHNVEISTTVCVPESVFYIAQAVLSQLYEAASRFDARPYFGPVLAGNEDLLVIPDECDANWLKLDGRAVLALLARTSSVQFTVSIDPIKAIAILNRLGANINQFLADYPQDPVWQQYISDSTAGYSPNRYGGPLQIESLEHYCLELSRHDVVVGPRLYPLQSVDDLNIPLHIRSVWWHFRLKRYGDTLCIEVRPMARRTDDEIANQLAMVLEFFEE
jgi:hypothetical protein